MTATAPAFSDDPDLNWSSSWQTGDERMDQTHREFVQMLVDLRALPASDQLPLLRKLIAHTIAHFEQEDRWMLATGFTADNCHTLQHKSIIDTLQAVEAHYLQGETHLITRLAEALAEWFPMHAQSMDAGLAQHMQSLGFDTRTEMLPDPSKVRPASMSGCGSVSCS